jgi:hypothetical protein
VVITKERMMQTSFIITHYAIPITNCNGDLKYGELSVGRASCTHYSLQAKQTAERLLSSRSASPSSEALPCPFVFFQNFIMLKK